MNTMRMIALAACAAAVAGCTSATRIEWGGKMAVRDSDGTVIKMPDGTPCYESGKNVYEDSNWLTRREERDVRVDVQADGSYTAALGSRVNDVSTNGIAMVTGGIGAATRLVAAIGDAYARIAGGGAQASTVLSSAQKVYEYFVGKGGDASKANVTVDEAAKTLKVDDGSTCVECDADGNCADCSAGSPGEVAP